MLLLNHSVMCYYVSLSYSHLELCTDRWSLAATAAFYWWRGLSGCSFAWLSGRKRKAPLPHCHLKWCVGAKLKGNDDRVRAIKDFLAVCLGSRGYFNSVLDLYPGLQTNLGTSILLISVVFKTSQLEKIPQHLDGSESYPLKQGLSI